MFKKRNNSEIDKKKINQVADLASKVLSVTYFLLIALCIYLVLLVFKETNILSVLWAVIKVVVPLFIGIVVAWLFNPFVKWLEKQKIKRTWGAVISYLILFVVIFVIMSALIPLLTDQIMEFVKAAPDIFSTIKDWCLSLFDRVRNIDGINTSSLKEQFLERFNEFAVGFTSDLPNQIFSTVSGLFSGVTTFVLGLIIGFFLLISFDSNTSLLNYLPRSIRQTSSDLFNSVNKALRKYVQGALIDCSAVFILTSIGLWIVGLKAPALFGFFCGLTNIIPYVGPYIGGAPAVIVGFTQSPTIGILTLVVIVIVQFLEGNFLQPYIMSKTTKLHPVTIMLGLLVFGYFFGILGMLLSTPILTAIKTVLAFFNEKYNIIEKEEVVKEAVIEVKEEDKE